MNLTEPTVKTKSNLHELSYAKVTLDRDIIESAILDYDMGVSNEEFEDFICERYSMFKIGPRESRRTAFIFQYLHNQCGIKYVHGLNSFVLLLLFIKRNGGDMQKAFNNFIDILQTLTANHVGSNMLLFTYAGVLNGDAFKLLTSHEDFKLIAKGRNKNSSNMVYTFMYTNEYDPINY